MRTLLFCLLATTAVGAYGEERAWTISYTTQAELVAVRGDVAFLKSADGVQSVPLERLSDSDRQFVASLPMAPIQDPQVKEVLASEMLPPPDVEKGFVEPAGFTGPQSGPALASPIQTQGDERSVLIAPRGGVVRAENYESAILPTPSFVPDQAPTARAIPQNRNGQTFNGSNQQRPLTQKQQRAADKKRAEADSRPGLFGNRNRRLLGERN